MGKIVAAAFVLLVAAGALWYFFGRAPDNASPQERNNTETNSGAAVPAAPEVIADGLVAPWDAVFISDDEMLVTERPGRVQLIAADGSDSDILLSGIGTPVGEGGLLGVALHPDFDRDGFVYFYYTEASGEKISNTVVRYRFDGANLAEQSVIVANIPGSANHNGGRLAFGPDGYLYIGTGDSQTSSLAQDRNSLAGKILRVTPDGGIPSDNPFGNAVYSYGHRNVQGLAWDESGQLWATEHGRSGVQSGYDELNKIVRGGNYGWPAIEGDETRAGMLPPARHSGATTTWAPSGLAYVRGHLLFTGLRGEALYVSQVSDGVAGEVRNFLKNEYGRLRAVVPGADGMLYLLTSNRDGRGSPVAEDDRIIRIDPVSLGL